MSEDGKLISQVDDTISTEEDIPGSSISFSIGDNSVRIKEKPKPDKESNLPLQTEVVKDQWWLKKPSAQLEVSQQEKKDAEKAEQLNISPDESPSMKDFLSKERMCKTDEADMKGKDDTLHDIIASVAFDKQPSDLDNATDEDIGSMLEEMSRIAGATSPIEESVKSKTINKILTEEDRSVEELLKEAEKLVQQNSNDLLRVTLKSELSVSEENDSTAGDLKRVRQLEVDIFKMIEQKVDEDDSVKAESNPSMEVLFENLTRDKDMDTQKMNRDKQKIGALNGSNKIDIHVKPEQIGTNDQPLISSSKESLQKEIIDVDKDFFEALIEKTKESAEQMSSCSSSFDQEDFNNFLKLLQGQSEKDKNECSSKDILKSVVNQFDPLSDKNTVNERGNPEIVKGTLSLNLGSIESESSVNTSKPEKLSEECAPRESSKHTNKNSSKRSSSSTKASTPDIKKVVNDNNELYTVGLTPRLELFADAIPKLLAEKTSEASLKKDEKKVDDREDIANNSDDDRDFSFKDYKALKNLNAMGSSASIADMKDSKACLDPLKNQLIGDFPNMSHSVDKRSRVEIRKSSVPSRSDKNIDTFESANLDRNCHMEKSRSFDQLAKPSSRFGSSLESVRTVRSSENRTQIILPKKPLAPKIKVQPRTVTKPIPKTRAVMNSKREPLKPSQSNLSFGIRGNQIKSQEAIRNSHGGGDYKPGSEEQTLEMLYQEERERFMYLKDELEAEIETHKSKLKDVQMLHEQEMFSLKKHNILLKAKLDELSKTANDARSRYDPKIISMQREIERLENLVQAYETENKKLMQENKRLQNEAKTKHHQNLAKMTIGDGLNNNQDFSEKLKDLQEENVKYSIELTDLRQKNGELSLKNEDVVQQNCLLQEELDMIKDQLRAKNDFITDRLQSMTTNELELRKKVEDLKVELHCKTEQLKSVKTDFDNFQQSVAPLEKELLELREKCSYFQEKLQVARHNCEREKQLTQKLKDQVILDNKNIMDLNRQVREMERILKRKNPDSVSALILTANSENEKLYAEKVKLLEERIMYLESEIKAKEDVAETKLFDIQKKFSDMKEKYSAQIMDLEQKLKIPPPEKKSYCEISTQTMPKILESRSSEPNLTEKINSIAGNNKPGPKSQNLKEDTHLIATIRGLKLEIVNKEKLITKLNKDVGELQKTNRKLQKEREKSLSDRKNLEKLSNRVMASSDSKLSVLKQSEGADSNSNFFQNGFANGKKLSSSSQRLHDTVKFAEAGEISSRLKKLTNENEVLREELSRINKDFAVLKNKRLQDLSLLQEEHEKEIALIVKECATQVGDTKALKLQGQVNSQLAMISHLKQQIEKLQDYKEQVIILKAERDHLEGKNRMLNEKVKYLSTPGTQQLQVLQEKISILQQRHETRELSLQKLVRDLLRSRNQACKDCKQPIREEMDKPLQQESCYYRQELDSILGHLQDLTSP
ncbi:hypothetical protein QAD02_022606 [Eretmocerus hayati]|uniref:Uncharacterized protein n=1 Tax=Eretmocerus hayati TaxID=131215 RepID=A0ACC2PTR1_9HYME|nr:hypothetical protein QAD02_022606 [Eretmocerus hayati]